jgi:hypothetical protein
MVSTIVIIAKQHLINIVYPLTYLTCVATLLWESGRMKLTFPKLGLGSPPRLSKLQSSIAKVKTPRIWVLFISLESYRSVHVENGLAWAIWTLQHKLWQKKRSKIKLAIWLSTIKSQESTQPRCVQVECDTPLESLKDSYKFALDLIPIEGLSKELWPCQVLRVQTETVSELLLGSSGTKSHSDVGATERRRKYYMGEGGGFP